jgi:hypothetical protein
MFARGFLSLRRAALSASLKNSVNSNYSRTYEPIYRKSNYSRTYTTPGVGVSDFLDSQVTDHEQGITHPQLLAFRHMQTAPASPFPTSLTQKQGGTGYWSYQFLARLDSASPTHQSTLLRRSPVLQWRASFPISSGESLHA